MKTNIIRTKQQDAFRSIIKNLGRQTRKLLYRLDDTLITHAILVLPLFIIVSILNF